MKALHLISVGADLDPRPGGMLHRLAERLAQAFHAPCRIRRERIDAGPALDVARGQYYSTEILRAMMPLAEPGTRLLGVTPLDLYVPVLTFVFGEAQLDGNCALVSYHRLEEQFYGLPAQPELTGERLLKEAVHELGHTFGLRHCSNWQCVMTSSHGVELLDVKNADFCRRCGSAVYGLKPVWAAG